MKNYPLLATGLLTLGLGQATAAELTMGTAVPPLGDGLQNLSFSTSSADNTTHDFVPNDYIAADVNGGEALALGQSFTTGSNTWGYLLNSISVRQVSWGPTNWDFDGGQVTIRVFRANSEDGALVFSDEVLTETVAIADSTTSTIGGTPTDPMWMTFSLTSPLELLPDTLYAFVFKSDATIDGSTNGFLMEMDGTDAETFAGGTSVSVPDGGAVLWKGGANSDRAFVANMTLPTLPAIPEVTKQPQNQSVAFLDPATFTCLAPADPEASYQWEYSMDGITGWTPISGEIYSTLTLNSVQFSDAGFYHCVASNVNGSDTSLAASLEVFYGAPLFWEQPDGGFFDPGSTVEFFSDAYTYGNPSYQWYKDGNPLPGETGTTLTLTDVSPSDEGEYFLRVTDDIEPDLFGDSDVAKVSIIGLSITSSDTAPSTDSSDEFYLPGTVADADNIGAGDDAFSYIAHDRESKGMSFTTGGDPMGYVLNAITIRQVANATWADVQPGDYFAFAFGTLSGTTKDPLYETTAIYAGSPINNTPDVASTGPYLTFDLSGAGIPNLTANTQYYFEITTEAGTGQVAYIDWNGTSAEGYAGGEAFGGDTVSAITPAYVAMTGDRAFHADLTGLSGPADDFTGWIGGYPGVGAENGFGDDPDGDDHTNGEENFFGTDPTKFNKGVVNSQKVGNTFVFEHPQNSTPASDVSAAYRWSMDLSSWFADGATSGGTTVDFSASPNTPVPGMTTVTATITGTMPTELFTDIEVIQTGP